MSGFLLAEGLEVIASREGYCVCVFVFLCVCVCVYLCRRR
jgi:hypothetical protein